MRNRTDSQQQIIAECYTAHLDEMVNYAASRLGNRQESEDLVQDIFVKMMTYEGIICKATVRAFAFTLIANKIKDLLRRRIFRARMEEHTKYEMCLQYSPAERIVDYHDRLRCLESCIDRLSPACAKVYRMNLFDDMATADIARKLNVSKRTVEAQLFTARKQVRNNMRKEA